MKTYTIKEASEILHRAKSTIQYRYTLLPPEERTEENGILLMTEEGLHRMQEHFQTARTDRTNENNSSERTNETERKLHDSSERNRTKVENTEQVKILEDRIKSLEIENAVLTERITQMQVNETERKLHEAEQAEQMKKQIDSLQSQVLFLQNQLQSASVNLYKALPEPRTNPFKRLLEKITGKAKEG